MRIAVITPGQFGLPSARSSSVEQVVHETSQRLKQDVNYLIFSRRTDSLPRISHDTKITYRRFLYRSKSKYLSSTIKPLRQFKPHIIQVENRPGNVLYYKKKFPKSKIWLSLHSTTFISPAHISRKILRRCLKRADCIIVNSHFLASVVQSKYPKASGKTFVNYLGVDLNTFRPSWADEQAAQIREQMRQKLGYMDKKIILYIGRLIPIKGVHLLLQAMPSIIHKHPDAVLVIVGSAYYGSDRITPYVANLHKLGNLYPNHVRFIPFVPHNEIYKWYNMADLSVVPSQGEEAFGLINVEAMACGLPVVAAKSGGIIELVQDGETGTLIDCGTKGIDQMADAINKLLNDSALRETMGMNARERMESLFSWEHTAARMHEAYQDAVNKY